MICYKVIHIFYTYTVYVAYMYNCTHEFTELVLRFASGSPSTGSLPSALMSPFRSTVE